MDRSSTTPYSIQDGSALRAFKLNAATGIADILKQAVVSAFHSFKLPCLQAFCFRSENSALGGGGVSQMRFASIVRRLFMPLDPARHPQFTSPSISSLKRQYAQAARAHTEDGTSSYPSDYNPSSDYRSDSSDQALTRPRKLNQTESLPSNNLKMNRAGTSSGRRTAGRAALLRPLPEPFHDEAYIQAKYLTTPMQRTWRNDAKSTLNNWCALQDIKPVYRTEAYRGDKCTIYRTEVRVPIADQTFIGVGDHMEKKLSEKLAAQSALIQLASAGVSLDMKSAPPAYTPLQVTLSDASVVDLERARQFMDYYCRRFGFGNPDIEYTSKARKSGSPTWEAVMTVGGRRIGMGGGKSKKDAQTSCYVDVTQYLEKCDPELWKRFVEDSKHGRDLGLAPAVLFQVDQQTEDQIQSLCSYTKKTLLYHNRPRVASLMTGDDDPQTMMIPSTPPRYIVPSRRQASEDFLTEKSKLLLEKRQNYLADPTMKKMRDTRASLPVYTKADDVLQHIRDNDVTICMAATGSGKTTQIPQLILDEWIEKGEGSKCNIFCTQPRRIAAISVAQRVAAERGESVGNGSIGYQVRFEAKLPVHHGSVTFCTTGIFLKRMQSALSDSGRDGYLEDVTHLVVDEVHERDVDTDLLLVVLKRLLADRRARGKPLKIILMSATIDPKLFQEYFPDQSGRPASVIEVPGRSFPVRKHFMDDFIPSVVKSADSNSRWVFQEQSVQKYLTKELGVDKLASLGVRSQTSTIDDLDLPYPLIALTIAYVLSNSHDGHVLVFLPGWDDIVKVQRSLQDSRRLLNIDFSSNEFSIHCLHSSVPIVEQQRIFEPPPQGQRRIILATNIAETSVTIPDVVYVVDTAKVKEQRYDPERHISSLVSAWVGSSNLNQRAGRAGRHRSGEYYGIIGLRRANELHPHQTVEMKRVDLSNIVMHVKALNFPTMSVEEVLAATIEPPAAERVEAAMQSLQMIGALDDKKGLTSLGRVLLQLPVDAQMGKLVLYGSFFRCLDQALSLAAILTNRDPFVSPMHLKNQAAACKNSFSPEEFRSDALTILQAYNQWWSLQGRGNYVAANRFCVDNFLSKPTLLMIQKIKTQLLHSLYDVGVIDVSAGGNLSGRTPRMRSESSVPPELNENGESLPLLAGLIAVALQPKFAIRTTEKNHRTSQDKSVFMHPSSVNHRKRIDGPDGPQPEKQLFAYVEKRQNMTTSTSANAQKFLVTTTRLDPLTYILFGAYKVEVNRRGLLCDQWLPISGDVDTLDDIARLKVLMESCMLRVFEGITNANSMAKSLHRGIPQRVYEKEDEAGDEDDVRDTSLTATEVQELDLMSRKLVSVLNSYSSFRITNQSHHNSYPGTPVDTPRWDRSSLPGSSRSGYSTPHHPLNAVDFQSRPNTPSRLSRR